MGKAAKQWAGIQQEHYSRIRDRRQGKRWLTMVIKQVMLMAWDMWADRNNINQTDAAHLTKRKEELDNKIREEFEKGKNGLERDEHHRLDIPIQTILEQYSEHRKQLWLNSVCRARNFPKPAPPPPTSLDVWLRTSGANNLADQR